MTEHAVGTGMLVAGLTIFVLAYALIATDKVPKATVALGGAALMILIGVLHQEQAFAHIDLNVILLLIGMMVVAGILRRTGAFQYAAIVVVKWTRGNGVYLMMALCFITAVLSGALDNVTTVILIAPITLFVTRQLGLNPVPFFITEILASNLGGTGTLIGDPPNILIGSAADLDFATFAAHMTPPVLVILPVFLLAVWFVFRRHLVTDARQAQALATLHPREAITDMRMMWTTVGVLVLTIVGFLIHGALGWEPATIAIAGAALMMVVTRTDPHEALQEVEWPSVLFFVGLFMMVGGMVELGVLERIAQFAIEATHGDVTTTALLTIWLSGLLSAIVDNIPYTAAMLPIVQQMTVAGLNPDNVLWWSLALGADFGGNATIIGASANVIMAGIAAREGHPISFRQFLRYGVPTSIGTLSLATGWVWLRYLAFA